MMFANLIQTCVVLFLYLTLIQAQDAGTAKVLVKDAEMHVPNLLIQTTNETFDVQKELASLRSRLLTSYDYLGALFREVTLAGLSSCKASEACPCLPDDGSNPCEPGYTCTATSLDEFTCGTVKYTSSIPAVDVSTRSHATKVGVEAMSLRMGDISADGLTLIAHSWGGAAGLHIFQFERTTIAESFHLQTDFFYKLAGGYQSGPFAIKLSPAGNDFFISQYETGEYFSHYNNIPGLVGIASRETRNDNFTFAQAIWANDPTATNFGCGFSTAVSYNAEVLAVGADNYNAMDDGLGVVEIYFRFSQMYAFMQAITSPNDNAGDWFGYSVALSYGGEFLAVTSGGASENNLYVYVQDEVTLEYSLYFDTVVNEVPAIKSGGSVAMSYTGSTIIVGDWNENSVHTFERDASNPAVWSMVDTQTDFLLGTARFGTKVALSGDGYHMAILDAGDDDPCGDSGRVHAYMRDGSGWSRTSESYAATQCKGNFDIKHISLSDDGTTLAFASEQATLSAEGMGASGTGIIFVFDK